MLLKKNNITAILCLMKLVYTDSPLGTPILESDDKSHKLKLPYEVGMQISRYEIMEAKLDAKAEESVPLHSTTKIELKDHMLVVDLSLVPKKSNRKYSISVTTAEGKNYFSESFIYDDKEEKYVLLRMYEGKPFYVTYAPHIGVALVVGGGFIVIVVYFVNRRRTKSEIVESL